MALHILNRIKHRLPRSWFRVLVNWWPPLLAAGIKIESIAPDYRTIDVILKMHWYNKNYVGTHFGGSIFAMTDPFYMLMLIENLGNDYIVWDKAASIDFKKPGMGTLHAHFVMSEETLQTVRDKTSNEDKYIFDLPIDIFNDEKVVVASVVRTLYVRRKDAFAAPYSVK